MDREPPILETPPTPLNTRPRSGWWKLLPVALIGGLGFLLYFISQNEPVSKKAYYPQCGFKQWTGYDCPGCGGLRATHAITHGRVLQAFRFHPGFVLSLPILAYLIGLWLREWRRLGHMPVPLAQPECNRPLTWIAILFISLGLIRNIPVPPFSWLATPPVPAPSADAEPGN